jgi:tRNA(adenine34) deaminase
MPKLDMSDKYERAMRSALEVAHEALASDDVPVGAIILDEHGNQVASGFNRREVGHDPTAHAEIVAMREAAELAGDWRLDNHTIVVTLEPCAMCAGAIAQSRIKTVVFGAWDEKAGAVGSVWDVLRDPRSPHRTEVIAGVLAEECASLLNEFFQKFRDRK